MVLPDGRHSINLVAVVSTSISFGPPLGRGLVPHYYDKKAGRWCTIVLSVIYKISIIPVLKLFFVTFNYFDFSSANRKQL